MKLLRFMAHQPIDGEFDWLERLDDVEFDARKARHLARRARASNPESAGATFIMAMIGVPASLVAGLVMRDPAWLISAGFWAWTLWGERLDAASLAGIAMIVASGAIIARAARPAARPA